MSTIVVTIKYSPQNPLSPASRWGDQQLQILRDKGILYES